ncbi:MAG: response regulator transcription factor [Flavobacteriales bacterium]
MASTNILLVDDQGIILDGLEAMLTQYDDLVICGRATNGRMAVEMTRNLNPDVVLMDINMPEMDGIEATRTILKHRPSTHVLILSMYNNVEFIHELMDAGACGYVLKNTDRTELYNAIQLATSGRRYLAPGVQATLDADQRPLAKVREGFAYAALTKREKEVVKLIMAELTAQQIADRLFLSKDTVDTHRKNIFSKLDIHTTAGIVKYAMERGWGELN